ncbi:MAG TPA: branched-chain amino acid ABC transporter ATP-binding protein/permease [Pseudolysinimonas sp.]|nr:branched-chain amino acid ABC transporter ATP-binding protein/permease [Pseudolysinimonas sp.]
MTRLAARRRPLLIGVAVIVLVAFPLVSDNLYLQNMLILTFLLAIGATGWNIMGGYAGYISLGNGLFVGVGAYTTAILAAKLGVPVFVGAIAGGLVSGIVAALLSLVTRRTRGMYFIIVTFAALQLGGLVARLWSPVTGGSQGLAMPLPTWDLAFQNWPFYYALLFLLIASIALSAQIRRSKLGTGLFAIQDDEDKASGLGIRTAVYKMAGFVASSVLVGIAGGIYAYYISYLSPASMFDIVLSVLMLLAALLGGRGTLWGPVLGAFIIEPLAELTTTNLGGANAGAIRLLLFAGILLVVVLFLPKGVLPTIANRLGRARATELLRSARAEAPALEPSSPRATDRPHPVAGDAVLDVRGLGKAFGGVVAVSDVDLVVPRGTITGVIGPNGSGKTTLFNLIDGTIRQDRGTVSLDGRRIERASRPERAHAGLARTYQLPRLFPSLSVIENVLVPERHTGLARLFRTRLKGEEHEHALEILRRFGLAGFAEISPAELSYGQRKLVELAQVMTLEPKLIMLDEPAAGISPALSLQLQSIIRELNSSGVSVLLVEHDLSFIGALCDNTFVMANGAVIGQGSVEELSTNPAVVDAYLGESSTDGTDLAVTP